MLRNMTVLRDSSARFLFASATAFAMAERFDSREVETRLAPRVDDTPAPEFDAAVADSLTPRAAWVARDPACTTKRLAYLRLMY
jgi:hypothetical protein